MQLQKAPFSKCFRPHLNVKLAFSDSSGLKNVHETLRFRDGLVWTVGLNVEIKLRFKIFPALWTLFKVNKQLHST